MPDHFVEFAEKMNLISEFLAVYKLQRSGNHIPSIKRKWLKRYMIAFGGAADDGNLYMEKYCHASNSWEIVKTGLIGRRHFAIAIQNDTRVYIIGGLMINGVATNEVILPFKFNVLFDKYCTNCII